MLEVLGQAHQLGLVGPGPVTEHLAHARGFAEAVGSPPEGEALDLGSGAGLPGLPLALTWPNSRWVLVDAQQRRSAFLDAAISHLGLGTRVTVVQGRAELIARDPQLRGRFGLVVARSFGPPAVTAECAAGFLRAGGRLVVSEPPDPSVDRWPDAGLAQLGMRAGAAKAGTADTVEHHFQVIEQVTPCPPRYPRRTGIPAKRPLY